MTSMSDQNSLPNVNSTGLSFILDISKLDLMEGFNKSALTNPLSRVKLNIHDKKKCNHSNCVKYASYNYLLENMNLCWYHSYTY